VVYPSTWAFWAKLRFGWSEAQIGLSLAWVGFLQLLVQIFLTERVIRWAGERGASIAGLGCAAATLFAYAFTTQGWQVYAFFLVGCLGALAWPALNGTLSRMVDATRQGALQGGIGSMNSVAAVFGPLIAAQSLAWGARHGFDGAAFAVAGALIGTAMLIILLGVRFQPEPLPATR
jgi:DHA1 family tetracycline resistance protein-like MFS transporter